jgi:hypothetical protein
MRLSWEPYHKRSTGKDVSKSSYIFLEKQSPTYANFKDQDGPEKHPFRIVKGVYPAVNQLERTHGEQIGARVPSHIIDAVKVIGDLGDGRA